MREAQCAFLIGTMFICACGGSPDSTPSPVAGPSPAPLPSPTPAPTPTPTPVPLPAATFVIDGIVHDGFDESPLANVSISQTSSSIRTATDGSGRFEIHISPIPGVLELPQLVFSRAGFLDEFTRVNQNTTLDVILPRNCGFIRRNPAMSIATGSDYLDFTWSPVAGARDYQIEVTRDSRSAAIELERPNVFTERTGGRTSYRWNTPNSGTYLVRYRARDDCSLGWPSFYQLVVIR